MDTATYKEALVRKRTEILASGGGVKPLHETMSDVNSRQGDLADQASGNNKVHIQLKLKQTDAKILQAIEEALRRIEKGTYGVCRDCGEEIAAPRLNAIPWTRVCITCKDKQNACSRPTSSSSSTRSTATSRRWAPATLPGRGWSATT